MRQILGFSLAQAFASMTSAAIWGEQSSFPLQGTGTGIHNTCASVKVSGL